KQAADEHENKGNLHVINAYFSEFGKILFAQFSANHHRGSHTESHAKIKGERSHTECNLVRSDIFGRYQTADKSRAGKSRDFKKHLHSSRKAKFQHFGKHGFAQFVEFDGKSPQVLTGGFVLKHHYVQKDHHENSGNEG